MKIVSQTETEIVVEDSSVWISAVFGVATVALCAWVLTTGQYRLLLAGVLFVVFALVWLRRSRFVFNAGTQSVQWSRLRMISKRSGSIAFADISDIVIEGPGADRTGRLCRLAIRTSTGAATPMSDVFDIAPESGTALRTTLLNLVQSPARSLSASAANADAARTQQLNDSIRSLLTQGKKIDAILLVQQSEHLNLTEATFRVNQVANQMGTRQSAPKA